MLCFNGTAVNLYLRKFLGCYKEFGLIESARRTNKEICRAFRKPVMDIDISTIEEGLAIGAAPKNLESLMMLKKFGFKYVIDLRAERKNSDILVNTTEVIVKWIPIYDDWRPKQSGFFTEILSTINEILLIQNRGGLFLCCGAGEHRAPMAGVLALAIMGHPLDRAIEIVEKARPVAELLPVYKLSIIEYFKNNK